MEYALLLALVVRSGIHKPILANVLLIHSGTVVLVLFVPMVNIGILKLMFVRVLWVNIGMDTIALFVLKDSIGTRQTTVAAAQMGKIGMVLHA